MNQNHHCYFIGTPLGGLPIMHHFLALARELAQRGNKVVLLVPHRRVDLEDHHANPAIYVWPSERPTKWRDARFLYGLIRQYRPDCLVANFAAVNIMMLVGWLTRVPQRVAWYHTLSAAIDTDHRLPAWQIKLLQLRKRLVYRVCTYLVSASAAGAADAQELYCVPRQRLRVFLNSLADPPLPPAVLAGNGTRERVVCVGRLFPTKGQDVLIKALPLVQQQHPNLTVEFVGDGPSRDAYAQLARDLGVAARCTFAGNASHAEVLNRLRAATVTVVPSRSDNCPLAAIESLAVGTPVIGSKVGGIPEIVRDGLDGFLVPPDDPPALAEKLGLVLSHAALRQEFRGHARQGFLERFEQRGAVRDQADWLEMILQ